MGEVSPILLLAGLSFFTSLAFTGFMVIGGLIDTPNQRSAHKDATALSGGVGIIAAIGLSMIALPYMLPHIGLRAEIAPLLSLLFATALIGLLDDIYVIPSGFKMGLLVGIAALAVTIIGPVTYLPNGPTSIALPAAIGFGGSLLWIFTVTNAVNFMDGSNGMLGLNMAVSSFVLVGIALAAGAPSAALFALILSAATAGMLPYNFRKKAQIFAGDVGALSIGFSYAVIVLLMVKEATNLSVLYTGPLLILPFLTDILLTMARRLSKGEAISQAHNKHIYQRAIRSGRSHLALAWAYGLTTLILGHVAMMGAQNGWLASPMILIVPVIGLSLLYLILSKRLPD